jgi:hypothetical protein
MEQRMRNLEEFPQYAADIIVAMEEDLRRRDELLQRMLQAVAVMQADIVRIDETQTRPIRSPRGSRFRRSPAIFQLCSRQTPKGRYGPPSPPAAAAT